MTTAKLFANGQSQAVRLPKEYRFSGTEVGVARLGEMVVLFPKERNREIFAATEPVTDDFAEAILNARAIETPSAASSSLVASRL
ncbi:MAG: type II toxin-antitoxin system VapB family antitoxin [Ruminococcus sp.]|jgi:antitoxin VapB|nr:type II toxin-antitoxin system VapB family antitoxin [Ruminococcus sp.]